MQKFRNIKEKFPIFIWLLFAFFIVRSFVYLSFTPPWQGPDEPQQYDYIHYLQTEKKLPRLGETKLCPKVMSSLNSFYFYEQSKNIFLLKGEVLDTKEKTDALANKLIKGRAAKQVNQIAQHPPLYYITGAVITWPFKDGSILTSIFILRIFGALLGLGVVIFTFLTVSLIFEKNRYAAYSATAFVAINPMFTHVMTTVSNDALHNFLFVLFVYLMVVAIKKGIDAKAAGVIGLVIAAGLLTKFFFVITVPLLVMTLVLFKPKYNVDYSLGLSSITTLFLATPYYVRNVILYGAIQPNYKFRLAKTNIYAGKSFISYLTSSGFFSKLFISFWTNFGWIKPKFTKLYLIILALFVVCSLVGLVIYLIRLSLKKDHIELKWLSVFLASFIFLFFAIAYNSYSGATITGAVQGVQGRYLFSFIGVIGLMLYLGIRQLMFFKPDYSAFVFITAGLILLDFMAMFYFIFPYFYF